MTSKKAWTVEEIALAFTAVCKQAGRSYGDAGRLETPQQRADNLVRLEYIRLGDPHDWCSSGSPIATIYCEPQGGEGDCEPPARYWSRWPVLMAPGIYWEWNNSAVGHVWPTS